MADQRAGSNDEGDDVKVSREHRIPKQERSSFPTCWVLWYTWRRVVFFTPKVGLRSWQIIVSTLPKTGWLFGIHAYRDEDDDLIVMLGLGVIDVEINTMKFLSAAELAAIAPLPKEAA